MIKNDKMNNIMKQVKNKSKLLKSIQLISKITLLVSISILTTWILIGFIIVNISTWKYPKIQFSFKDKLIFILAYPIIIKNEGKCFLEEKIFQFKIERYPQVSSVKMNNDDCHHTANIKLKNGGKLIFIDIRNDNFTGTKNLFFYTSKYFFEPIYKKEQYNIEVKKWNDSKMVINAENYGIYPKKFKTILEVIEEYNNLDKANISSSKINLQDKDYYYSFSIKNRF